MARLAAVAIVIVPVVLGFAALGAILLGYGRTGLVLAVLGLVIHVGRDVARRRLDRLADRIAEPS